MSVDAHKADAPARVGCFVLTISDTRTQATDTAGRAIRELLGTAGHVVTGHRIVRDDPAAVAGCVRQAASDPEVQIVITTGGTGITARDGTYEAVSGLLDKRLDGFGELFRMLSYRDIGPAAMMSRAVAGTIGRTAVFALPGSEQAVRLAMTELMLPELGHVAQQLAR
ncbi:MAG: MogA/MoaB family molybdenum cofactor biosynthesis protein [Acidimicrobiia bacterium]|nr:MogA/MoaB family molybdenum cofactor biosynthesis protein [Acidimicrobiia bacterium]